MSRYHVIDASEGKSLYNDLYQHDENHQPTNSPLPGSPGMEHYSTGRGDPLFPDIDMHLGMIFGMNSVNGPKTGLENALPADGKLHMRLKFLEDSNTVMQTRNHNLITENRALSSQLENEVKYVAELKSRLQAAVNELEKDRNKVMETLGNCPANRRVESKDQTISTTSLISTFERSAQCWAVCLACQQKLEGHQEASEPTVTITKSELESLEYDMQALRDAVVAREEAWDRAVEREENYRQQLARLSAETVTTRHLADSKQNELETLKVTLMEREAELKATQKDLLSLKKIIIKLEKHQRELEEASPETKLLPVSGNEQRTIDEIVRRRGHVKPKLKPIPKDSPSTPRSLQGSPRSAARTPRDHTGAANCSSIF